MPNLTLDDLSVAFGRGQTMRTDWFKTVGASPYTAGRWYDMSILAGHPMATTHPSGIGKSPTVYHGPTGDGLSSGFQYCGLHTGPSVANASKYALNISAYGGSATSVPSTLLLCDLLMSYPGIGLNSASEQPMTNSMTVTATSNSGLRLGYSGNWEPYTGTTVRFTTTGVLPAGLVAGTTYYLVRVSGSYARVATTLANAVAATVLPYSDAGTGTHTMHIVLPRYQDGVGVRMCWVCTTASGATAHNLATTYTNQDDVATRVTPGTVAATASAIVGHIIHSGLAANNYGPFLPLMGDDYGVKRVETVTVSAASGSGAAALLLVRPLAAISLQTQNVLVEKSLLSDVLGSVLSLPAIQPDACLTFLLFAGANVAASSTFSGSLETLWF